MKTEKNEKSKLELLRERDEQARTLHLGAVSAKMEEEEIYARETLVPEHGIIGVDIALVFSKKTGEMVAVKRPSKAAFRLYQSSVIKEKLPVEQIMSTLLASTLIYPTQEKFTAIQDHTPAIFGQAVNAAVKLGGASADESEGK